jgi:uncharacterized protein (DUF885 family)
MRGNNLPFSLATAFHEMIPGTTWSAYVNARHGGYRARIGGSTPFYTEGWPLYWELLMYDLGFHDTPKRRSGPCLADAPLRPHHLLAQVPHRRVVAAGEHRLPRRPRRA